LKILIIEDFHATVESISLALEMCWPSALVLSTPLGEQGIQMVETESPDVVILDLGLPDISGYDVLKRIRLFSQVPVLILTAKSDESDVVNGLEWGADDYVTKPFRHLELLSRLKAILRRKEPIYTQTLVCGPLRFNADSFKLTKDGKDVPVSRTEGVIIAHLMRNAGNTVSHASIAEEIWGDDYLDGNGAVKVHIRHIREKLEDVPDNPSMILTKKGIGYMLAKSN
jgi:two-component system, OmpR family, response regulator VicR